MQATLIPVLVVLLALMAPTTAFVLRSTSVGKAQTSHVRALSMNLDDSAIARLEEMRSKYDRLKSVVSDDAEKERNQLEPVVDKYKTYVEIKILMGKIRMMYKSEASESRKERQLNSFAQLYTGKLELEELLREKLGLPAGKTQPKIPELEAIRKMDKELADLEGKLQTVSLKIAPGMSTRDERFAR